MNTAALVTGKSAPKGLRCRLGFHKDTKKVPLHPRHSNDYWFECVRCGRFHDSLDLSAIVGLGGHADVRV